MLAQLAPVPHVRFGQSEMATAIGGAGSGR